MKKGPIFITLAIVAILALLIFTLFEYKDVPDVNWKQTYLPDSKEPYGTWMLRSLLNERYGSDNVQDRYKEINLEEIDSTEKVLLLMIGQRINLDFEETNALAEFSNAGNDIFIAGETIDFDYDWGLADWSHGTRRDSSLTLSYPVLSDSTFNIKFKVESLSKASIRYYHYFKSGDLRINSLPSDSTNVNSVKLKKQEIDISELITGLNELSDDTNISEYDYEDEEVEEDKDYGYVIGIQQDSASIYKEWNFGGDYVNLHLAPQTFTNEAAHQEFFLDHFNLLIGQFDYDRVVFEHPSFNTSKRQESESPIQFILENDSLKWAYYTMILGALLYVIFRGKRKQRIIPTLAPNNNTSLEYVQTLGSLYEHQRQPKKLVKHMEDIFYHDVKSRYFLDQHDGDFINKLSKKSNIALKEIEIIVKTFGTIEGRFEFHDGDLSMLYRRLDAFYKNCK